MTTRTTIAMVIIFLKPFFDSIVSTWVQKTYQVKSLKRREQKEKIAPNMKIIATVALAALAF